MVAYIAPCSQYLRPGKISAAADSALDDPALT
jgi:hypothetical protein